MALTSPYPPGETLETIRLISAADALRPRLVSQSLARQLNQLPRPVDASAGSLEQAVVDGNGRLWVSGSARIPNQNRPADCVIVGFEKEDGTWEPFFVSEIGKDRQPMEFSRNVDASSLPTTAVKMRACAVDLRNQQVFPLAGELPLRGRR